MSERVVTGPTPEHPITVEPEPRRVRVTAFGEALADTGSALRVQEASYPVVHYLPRADVDMSRLEPSDHASWCPFKGEASYFDLIGTDGARAENAVWTYEAPADGVAAIKDHLAFYPDKIDDLSVG